MTTDTLEVHETAVRNIHSFISLLNEDLLNSVDGSRELGSLTDLPDELDALDYDISRGVFNHLMERFQQVFFIAEGYNVRWESYKDLFYHDLLEDILILNIQEAINHADSGFP